MDYKETVFLPKTEFPMKAGLPRKEPEILKIWEEINIYQKLREQRKGSAPELCARPKGATAFQTCPASGNGYAPVMRRVEKF